MPDGIGYGIGIGASVRARFDAKRTQVGNAPGGPEVNSGQPAKSGKAPHVTPVTDRLELSDEVKNGRSNFKSGTTKSPLTYTRFGK